MLLGVILITTVFASQASAQCLDTLPDGTQCQANEYLQNYPDPDRCSWYFQCNGGCFTNEQCPTDFRYDTVFEWCSYPGDVDCNDRPCIDPGHCTTTTSTTTTTTEYCGHILDCDTAGDGYFPDPYNCRKYWHCFRGSGEPFICPDNQLYDLNYDGCNFASLVDCGERPICDACDENCVTAPTLPPTVSPTESPDCGGHTTFCHAMADGYYGDPYNCRKYWHCVKHDGDHYKCPDDQLFDLVYDGCNFPDNVDCGDRPVCGDCDEDCHDQDNGNHSEADCNDSGVDHTFDCSTKPLGWFADPFNCKKYYHCDTNYGTAKTHYVCPTDGTVYNQVDVACDWEERVNCGNRPVCDDCDTNCH